MAVARQLRLVSVAPIVCAMGVIAFSLSRHVGVSVVCLAVVGASMILSNNSINALLQQSVPDEWRGRVIGLYAMSFAGTAPLGALLAGTLAVPFGALPTLALLGVVAMASGIAARWRLNAHPEAMRSLLKALKS